MENKRDSLKKMIMEKLAKIFIDEGTVYEIMGELQDVFEQEQLLLFLQNNPYLVPSELYDELDSITGGRIKKQFCAVKLAKRTYLIDRTESNYQNLLQVLKSAELFMLYEWNLTEEDEKMIESAKESDMVTIEAPLVPALFFGETTDELVIPMYTSLLEIEKELQSEYAIQLITFEYATELTKAIGKVMNKKTALILDYDTDEQLELKDF